jgi:dihydropteroate synthase
VHLKTTSLIFLQLKQKPLIMGILNATPDSFFDGGKYLDSPDQAIQRALQMEADGAAIIDIGAESSRPGALPVSCEEEINRLEPILSQLVLKLKVPLSIDTQKPEVARFGLSLGARIINDINGFSSPEMIDVAKKFKAAAIVMHMQGDPRTMQIKPVYENPINEIMAFLEDRVNALRTAGVQEIAIDPGIGFGKSARHNLLILKNLPEFKKIGVPVAIGTSRKSFIGKVNGKMEDDRLAGSIASNIYAYLQGASILRVHDVLETKEAIDMFDAIESVAEREDLARTGEFPDARWLKTAEVNGCS